MAQRRISELKLISHSDVVYWWPAWVVGFAMAAISYFDGVSIVVEPGQTAYTHTSNNPGIIFIAVITLLVVFTNARLRGIYSAMTIMTFAFLAVLLAWLGWWDSILGLLPYLSAKANAGFYLLFASIQFVVWALAFFVFDRLTYWRVRPGQIVESRLVGGGEHSFDTQGLVFERRDQDMFRHILLGLGSGDLVLVSNGARKETINIPNVMRVDSKLRAIQQLISIKPDHASSPDDAAEGVPAPT